MTTSESFVKFDKVDKSYDGEVLVVKDLNLDIPKGEFLTMLGPSVSGKTTTLLMLAGFETPTGGEIYLEGEAINKIPPPVGVSNPANIINVVVFPEPDGPSIVRNSPCGISTLRSLTTSTSPS